VLQSDSVSDIIGPAGSSAPRQSYIYFLSFGSNGRGHESFGDRPSAPTTFPGPETLISDRLYSES
jgi:hypothetical protein